MSFIAAREAGSKVGSAGVMSATQANVHRRERLRQLALETHDLKNDPYFLPNHLGKFECKLCLTLHMSEASYLSHTQGKRHQENLGKRAAKLQKEKGELPIAEKKKIVPRKTIKIGRPGYKIIKQYDPETKQKSILFQIDYPQMKDGLQPRHRFMSSYEQKVEPANDKYQYVLVAGDPYETIGFKIPNREIDKREGKFFSHWDPQNLTFLLQLHFMPDDEDSGA